MPQDPTTKGEAMRLTKAALRDELPRIVVIFLLMLAATGASMAQPLLYRGIVDGAIPARDVPLLLCLLLAAVGLAVAESLLGALRLYQSASLGESISQHLRGRLFDAVLDAEIADVEAMKSSDLVYRLTACCGKIGEMLVGALLIPLGYNVLLALTLTAVMTALDWRLALAALSIVVPFFFISSHVRSRAYELDERFSGILEDGQAFLTETCMGIRTVRAFGGDARERSRFAMWMREHRRAKARISVFHELSREGVAQVVSAVAWGIVLGVSAYAVLRGRRSIGDLVAFVAYVPRLYAALAVAFGVRVHRAEIRASEERIEAVLAFGREGRRFGTEALAPGAAGGKGAAVELASVSFGYGRGDFSLREVSFAAEPGSFVGIVGPSGGGKSTVIDLILGLFPPESGAVLIDGRETHAYSAESLRAGISVVSQDIFLRSSSIADNIAYPAEDLPREAVERVARIAQLHDWVISLPDGYETFVGQRGLALSGGERQRIAIARALLRDSAVLLFDEATSALDALTEEKLQVALDAVRRGRTTIAVAHRFRTILQADKIVVLAEGRVLESGSVEELRRAGGLFAKMYQAQSLAV